MRGLPVLQMIFTSNTNAFGTDGKSASIYSIISCKEKIRSVALEQCPRQ